MSKRGAKKNWRHETDRYEREIGQYFLRNPGGVPHLDVQVVGDVLGREQRHSDGVRAQRRRRVHHVTLALSTERGQVTIRGSGCLSRSVSGGMTVTWVLGTHIYSISSSLLLQILKRAKLAPSLPLSDQPCRTEQYQRHHYEPTVVIWSVFWSAISGAQSDIRACALCNRPYEVRGHSD